MRKLNKKQKNLIIYYLRQEKDLFIDRYEIFV